MGRSCYKGAIDSHTVSTTGDIGLIVAGRAIRGFADGFVSVLLAQYLIALGFSPLEVGAIVTGTLLGSAALTLTFGLTAHRTSLRTLLLAATALMAATGLGFALLTTFWPMLLIAVVGTLNPSAGDVSVFLPTEQALVAGQVGSAERPRVFANYNVAGSLAGAFGALCSVAPRLAATAFGWQLASAQRGAFLVYAAAAAAIFTLYRRLGRAATPSAGASRVALGPSRHRALPTSRRIVFELSALFSLDSAGSGLVVTSLLVLWLHLRFDLSASTTAGVFFAAGLAGAASQFLAPRLAARIGLIRTMAFTHMPANLLLASAAFAPTGEIAIALLLTRALFSQMDVPARQAFVMAVVPADERAAASSVTNVPRSLASATTPLAAGALLARSHFGWPLVIAGCVKLIYDVLLLIRFRHVGEADRLTPRLS